jgi:hypothetical protein
VSAANVAAQKKRADKNNDARFIQQKLLIERGLYNINTLFVAILRATDADVGAQKGLAL